MATKMELEQVEARLAHVAAQLEILLPAAEAILGQIEDENTFVGMFDGRDFGAWNAAVDQLKAALLQVSGSPE